MPKKIEVTTNEARQTTTRPRTLGAMGIAFPLCDGGVGSRNGVDQSSIPPTIKPWERNSLRLPTPFAWNPNEYLMLLV